MWDGWETLHSVSAFTNDAALDPDGHAANNSAEFRADIGPQDSNSVLRESASCVVWYAPAKRIAYGRMRQAESWRD
jgi:hypothetical protein